jgi:hypothetical protein
VLVFVLVPPRVRVRVRVLLELARAAGWIAENTLMSATSCLGVPDGPSLMTEWAVGRGPHVFVTVATL